MNVIPATINHLGIYPMPEYYPPVIGTVVSIAVILVISARGKVSREENVYRLRLHRPPPSDIDLAKTKKTLLAPLGLIVYGVVMPLVVVEVLRGPLSNRNWRDFTRWLGELEYG